MRCFCRCSIAAVSCLMLACTNGGFNPCGNVPLDKATATISITQEVGAATADAVAVFAQDGTCPETLENGQEVAINGQSLSGPNANGQYVASVPIGSGVTKFAVFVNEPTLGVSETDIDIPTSFDVTAPTSGGLLSLSGMTFTWTSAEPTLDVEITIRQTLFGSLKTHTYGPFDDTGSVRLSATDLSLFAQGADLTVVVTRYRQLNAINGLKSGAIAALLTRTFAVTPAP